MFEIFKTPEIRFSFVLAVFLWLVLWKLKRVLKICAMRCTVKGQIKMLRITLQINGMRCSMCEAHLNDAIRTAHRVKKVTSSHRTGNCVILTECDIPDDVLQKTVSKTGYTLLSVSRETEAKKSFFTRLFGKRSKEKQA